MEKVVMFGSLVVDSILTGAVQEGRLILLSDQPLNRRNSDSDGWYWVFKTNLKSTLSYYSGWRLYDKFSVLVPSSMIDAGAEPSNLAIELLFLTDDGSSVWCLVAPTEEEINLLIKEGFVKGNLVEGEGITLSLRQATFDNKELDRAVWETVMRLRIQLASPLLA